MKWTNNKKLICVVVCLETHKNLEARTQHTTITRPTSTKQVCISQASYILCKKKLNSKNWECGGLESLCVCCAATDATVTAAVADANN